MRAKFFLLLVLLLGSQMGRAMACAVCFGARDSQTTAHMAIAIWVMIGAIMSVLGGVGAFSFHLWRHANTPLEPHQELTEEDFSQYD
jgi:ABC-type dipeptide/oligopeptide/nickel transport system permease subunit